MTEGDDILLLFRQECDDESRTDNTTATGAEGRTFLHKELRSS